MKLKKNYVAQAFPVLIGLAGAMAPFALAYAQEQIKTDADAGSMPMTKSVVSRSDLEAGNPQETIDALKSVAGVTNANAKGTISDNINIRGIGLGFSTGYRINGGLPINNILSMPMEDKERIEALKGANGLLYGLASPAGIVNLVTKRAGDKDITTFGVSGNGFGQMVGTADIGRKFGEDKQFGVRVNLANGRLETGVDGGKGSRQFGSIAADWQATKDLSFRLDYENYYKDIIEQATIAQLPAVNGAVPIPQVPDPTKLMSGPWAAYKARAENFLLHTDYAINHDWKVMAEGGQAVSERVTRDITRIGGVGNIYNVITGAGAKESITEAANQLYTNHYYKAETTGLVLTGPLRHNLTLGVMSSERIYNSPSTTAATSVPQNIYNPVPLPAPGAPKPLTYTPQESKDVGVYTYDTISVGRHWQFLGGVRSTTYDADNVQKDGTHKVTSDKNISPAAGVIYNFDRDTNVYASYLEGLEETGVAPAGTVNQFQILPPAAAKQKEIGVRSTALKNVTLNAALFDIVRANTMTDPASNVFMINGTTRFQGLETSANATLSREWSVNAGGQLMKAAQHSIDKTIDGLTPENTPKVTANASVNYKPSWVQGLSLNAGSYYTGPRYINPQNQGMIPGVVLYSLGSGYKTKIAGKKVAFTFNVDNVADKRYWSSAASGYYGVGMVRSYKMSGKIDF